MRRPSLLRIGLGVVVAVSLLGAGAAAALLLVTPTEPAGLAEATEPSAVPVAFEDFLDPRPVELAFTRAPDVSLLASVSGQVTAYACRAGGTLESGTSSLAVDGVPIVSIATSVPLWRDLAKGDTGDDVRALQVELQRLGFALAPDGELGEGSIDAVERLVERASGRKEKVTSIPRASLLWIPAASTETASCGLSLGGRIDPDSTVAVVSGRVSSLRVVAVPADALAGDRRLVVDDTVLVPSAVGDVTAEADLRAFAATASARAVLATEGATTVSAQDVLAEPVRVGVVPPSSLFALQGGTGCIVADGDAVAVTVVGSQLGQSSVLFAGGIEPQSVDVAPDPTRSCS